MASLPTKFRMPDNKIHKHWLSSQPSPTLQHIDEGPHIGRVTNDHFIPTISEWSDPALVCVFGVLTVQDMG